MNSGYADGREGQEKRVPFWAKCGDCGHVWIAAYYPIELRLMGKILGKAHCPNCGASPKRVLMAKQDDGKLLNADDYDRAMATPTP